MHELPCGEFLCDNWIDCSHRPMCFGDLLGNVGLCMHSLQQWLLSINHGSNVLFNLSQWELLSVNRHVLLDGLSCGELLCNPSALGRDSHLCGGKLFGCIGNSMVDVFCGKLLRDVWTLCRDGRVCCGQLLGSIRSYVFRLRLGHVLFG